MLPRHDSSNTPVHRTSTVGPAGTARLGPLSVRIGDWLWLCRAGSENEVCEELALRKITAAPLGAALVRSATRPSTFEPLVFARQGMPVQVLAPPDAEQLAQVFVKQCPRPVAVQVFAPDSDAGNLLSAQAQALARALCKKLVDGGCVVAADGSAAHKASGDLLQVCFLDDNHVAAGLLKTTKAQSLFPGGRQRFSKPQQAPSRSARKLEEALSLCGHVPSPGEICVDLGAAPGGFSQVLLQKGCHVIAIDPGALSPGLARRVEHLRMNAFAFFPQEPADWVVCDMAYRPLEVAGLLARWGRRRWARFLIANFKLPMKQRVSMVGRIADILQSGGWTGLKIRQLYHDRDEVTVIAWRGFGIDTRVEKRDTPGTAAKPRGPSRTAPKPAPAEKTAARRKAVPKTVPTEKTAARRKATQKTAPVPKAGRPATAKKRAHQPDAAKSGRRGSGRKQNHAHRT